MLLFLGAAALTFQVQVQVGPTRRGAPVVRDSTVADTATRSGRRRGIRQPVTAELAASAFKDQTAKVTLLRARTARMQQDSALMAYDAMAYQRISAGMGFTKIGRDRLIFRHESAARVRWQRDVERVGSLGPRRRHAPVAHRGAPPRAAALTPRR